MAPAVIEAAVESGVARRPVADMDAYRRRLQDLMCANDALIQYLIKAQRQC